MDIIKEINNINNILINKITNTMKVFFNNFTFKNDYIPFIYLFENIFMEKVEIGTKEESEILCEKGTIELISLIDNKNWQWSFLFLIEADERINPNIMNKIKDYSCVLKNNEIDNSYNSITCPPFVISSYSNNFTHKFVREKKNVSINELPINQIPEKDICVFISYNIEEENKKNLFSFINEIEKKYSVDYVSPISFYSCSPPQLNIISKYKIVIILEDYKSKNYITEKILNSFATETIPVYWGSDNIEEYFNRERFINIPNWNEENIMNTIKIIDELINDKNKYLEMVNKPIYNNNRIPFTIYDMSNKIKMKLNISKKQKINFLSFGGPTSNYHHTLNRICNEARNLEIFDEITAITDHDLKKDEEFWKKNGQFIESNYRGYGYWLWKPYVINKRLQEIADNDILIYCDAGCELNKNGLQRVFEYIDALNTNIDDYGIFSFRLRHKEISYTKNKIFEYFNTEEKDKPLPQCMATIMIIKKNQHSINVIKEWYEICSNNHHLINDERTNEDPQFIDNRHDQSIYSMLVKKYGSIKVYDETYFNEVEFNERWGEESNKYPLLAKRLR